MERQRKLSGLADKHQRASVVPLFGANQRSRRLKTSGKDVILPDVAPRASEHTFFLSQAMPTVFDDMG